MAVADGERPMFRVVVKEWRNVGDDPTDLHVEYCVDVVHRGGFKWRTWRRFSDFDQLHAALAADSGDISFRLPAPPQKSYLPPQLQGISSVFCDHRHRELQAYLDEVMSDPVVSRHAAVREFLGVRPPEQPEGLRVLARETCHELEVRPCVDVDAAPVDGYIIRIHHVDEDEGHQIRREVGCAGNELQKAQIGQLQPGVHTFSVFAYNIAGMSADPAIIVVDTAKLPQGRAPDVAAAAAAAAPGAAPAPPPRPPARAPPPEGFPLQQAAPPRGAPALPAGRPGAVAPGRGDAAAGLAGAAAQPHEHPAAVRYYPAAAPPQQQVAAGLLAGWAPAAGAARGAAVGAAAQGGARAALPQAAQHHAQHQGQFAPSGWPPRAHEASASSAVVGAWHGYHPAYADAFARAAPGPSALGPLVQQHPGAVPGGQAQAQTAAASHAWGQPLPAARIGRDPHFAAPLGQAVRHALEPRRPPALGRQWEEAPASEADPEGRAPAPRGGCAPGPRPAERLEPRRQQDTQSQSPTSIDDDGLCVVCLSSDRSHAFVPCGHRCVCKDCGLSVMREDGPKCPLCRSDAVSTLHIFN